MSAWPQVLVVCRHGCSVIMYGWVQTCLHISQPFGYMSSDGPGVQNEVKTKLDMASCRAGFRKNRLSGGNATGIRRAADRDMLEVAPAATASHMPSSWPTPAWYIFWIECQTHAIEKCP